MKNVLTPIAKSVLVSLGLKAAGSATNASIQEKSFWIGDDCTDNHKRKNNIMQLVKSLGESGLLIKGISETIKHEAKEKKWISWYVIRYISCNYIGKYVSKKT